MTHGEDADSLVCYAYGLLEIERRPIGGWSQPGADALERISVQ
jgi:hypothetical protein